MNPNDLSPPGQPTPHLDALVDKWLRRSYERHLLYLRLSPTPDVWAALMAGESVPADRLDQEWLAEYRRRGLWPTST